ncbi:hypothetical protein AWB77_03362 [Caballeronia fortuita]|uniref:Uncharacterized protein n=1 Tax=Caballeronia fortuita TaxID=1777138 RepID=A0A158BXB4_9BURK|nr:hypothetical protein [Caballeronia fortuita]SAK74715.1 hypothetical protein AWB77_03362 [Caballeronia fortuita]
MASWIRLLRRLVDEKKFLTGMGICIIALGLQGVLYAKSLPGQREHALIRNGAQNCSFDFIDPYRGWMSGNDYVAYNLPYNKTRIGNFSINFECISSADTKLIRAYTVARYDQQEQRWEADFSGLSESDRNLLAPVTKWLSVEAVNSSGFGALQDLVTGDPEIRSTSLGFCLLHPPVALCGSAPVVAIPFHDKVGVLPMVLKVIESIEFVDAPVENDNH